MGKTENLNTDYCKIENNVFIPSFLYFAKWIPCLVSHMICVSYNLCLCGGSQKNLDIGWPYNAIKLHFRVETDNKIVLHKFYNNLELKERLFTDARNDSFLWSKTIAFL